MHRGWRGQNIENGDVRPTRSGQRAGKLYCVVNISASTATKENAFYFGPEFRHHQEWGRDCLADRIDLSRAQIKSVARPSFHSGYHNFVLILLGLVCDFGERFSMLHDQLGAD